jgi:hypothetical protein
LAEFGGIVRVEIEIAPTVRVSLWIGGPDDLAHAERAEQVLPGEIKRGHAGGAGQNRREHVEIRAAVFPAGSRLGHHRPVERELDPVIGSAHLIERRLIRLRGAIETGHRAGEMLNGHLLLAVSRVGNLAVREEGDQRLIERQSLLIDRNPDQGRHHALGD